ncbi:MAG: phosphoethanolamine transferase [Megasphaera sp.]|jgi:heptose-I-phosphate ethanolaminephosphotransferase|nr:phosphoethanolamine transferase [Megasphaera sp.]MCH4187377.1 phosphoethanolamine transferase [Megasphaera sp.]MCH4217559.1 phosphoethanolamine transferase [Megasphaera sp.]
MSMPEKSHHQPKLPWKILFPSGAKRTLLHLLLIFAIIYALCFQWEMYISLGLGPDNIEDMTLGLIPAIAAIIISLGLYWKYATWKTVLPPAIIAAGWVITGPYLSYITLINKNTIYLNNIYDIYTGLYLFSILFCLNMIIRQFLRHKLGAALMTIIQFASFFIIALQWVYFGLYHSSITTSGALLICQTGPAETLEFFHSLGLLKVAAIALFVSATIFSLYWLNFKQKELPLSPFYRKALPLLSLLIIFPSAAALGDEIFPECFPIRTFLDTHDYMERSALYAENHSDKFAKLQAVQLTPANDPNTIIVVIGESETRTLMNAYNPEHVPNTPWLTGQKNNPNFTLFTNVYSCVWYTVPVLEHALTESNFYNDKQFNESISIIDMAKKAGYKTYWFSNQGSVGVADTPITLVANTADVSEWVDRDLKESTHDEALLHFLKQVDPNEKNFVVLHIMGSHIEYRNRYPVEFQQFNDGTVNQEADFDNTVLYTDWFLSQVYDYARKNLNLDAMVYFSDHGSDPDVGRAPDGDSFKVLRIPMFCYLSDEYQRRNPQITDTIKEHTNNYFTNDLEYEFICGLLNMQSPNYDPSYSLASPQWHMGKADLVTRFGKTSLTEDPEF